MMVLPRKHCRINALIQLMRTGCSACQTNVLNSRYMKRLCFTLLLGSLVLAQDAPKTMSRITVQLDGSEVPQNSYARKPKTIYRAGSTYCRVEEALDPEHDIRGLLIVNEPNAWMVNLATKTAQHFVDPGPSFHCHLPVFSGPVPNTSDEVNYAKLGLEFGYELEYFKKMGAVRQDPGPVLQKQQTVASSIWTGPGSLCSPMAPTNFLCS